MLIFLEKKKEEVKGSLGRKDGIQYYVSWSEKAFMRRRYLSDDLTVVTWLRVNLIYFLKGGWAEGCGIW